MRFSTTLRTLTIVAFLISGQAQAAKTDVVLLVNGNAITGEVKSLDFGSLALSTDSMGRVSIDWEDIVGFSSNQNLQIELADGRRYLGNIEASEERFHVKVVAQGGTLEFATDQIVRIVPIETDKRFLERLDGRFSMGLNTQKSSGVSTFNIASDISYRTPEYLVGLRLNSSITDQPSEETKARDSVGLNYKRFRDNRWFTEWFTSWERNDELGINSRVLGGGALGRYLVQSNTKRFSIAAGLVATHESFIGVDESTTQAEGRIQLRLMRRSLDPDSSFGFTTNIFPLLEDPSQYRAETDIGLRHEFIKDLFFEVLLYHSYVSDPPTGAETSDYGLRTSVGYSF